MVHRSLRAAAAGAVAAMAIGGAVVTATTSAQAESSGRQITGTWRVMVQPDGPPTAPAFESTLVYTATGSVVEATSKAPASAGLGSWERLGAAKYAMTIVKYRFNGATYVGKTVIEETQELDADGSHYSGRAVTTVLDASGKVLARFSSSAIGERI